MNHPAMISTVRNHTTEYQRSTSMTTGNVCDVNFAKLQQTTKNQSYATVTPMSRLQFHRAILLCNFIARQNRSVTYACRTLQLCRINDNWPINVHSILATKLHRIEHCSIREGVVTVVRHTMSQLRFCRAINMRDKIAG